MIWLWRSQGSRRTRMLLLPSYHYLWVTMALYPLLCWVFSSLLFLHNASLEIKYRGVYFRLSRRSDRILSEGQKKEPRVWREIKYPRWLFSSLNIYRADCVSAVAWEKKQTQEELWRLRDHQDECHLTPESIVMVSGWHRCSWHRYQDASDTRPKTRPTWDTLIVIWVGGGPEGQKIWKNKRNQPQQSPSIVH